MVAPFFLNHTCFSLYKSVNWGGSVMPAGMIRRYTNTSHSTAHTDHTADGYNPLPPPKKKSSKKFKNTTHKDGNTSRKNMLGKNYSLSENPILK